MKKFTIIAVLLVSGCAYHDQVAMDRAVDYCSKPLAAGEKEDFAQTDYCVRQAYYDFAEERRQNAAESLAASSAAMNASVQAMQPHSTRCTNFNGIVSCTGR